MNSNFYYILAINLSLLTFYIGALIYALPIPDKYFKRFGPQLIKDSILSFIIILSISFIYSYLDNLALSLGGSWQYFNLWFANSLSFGISIKEIVLVFSSLFSQIPLVSQVRSLLSPINDALNAQIIFLAAIYAIYYMVKIMGNFILLIGLVLYSIPFRLSRDAGAWFISFILVFSIGLQVMPVFLVNFAQSSNSYTNNQGIDMGLTYVNARVLDENNEPIPGSLIYVYVNQNNSLNQIALYKTNDLGIVYSPDYNYDSLISLPSQVSSYIWGEEDGVAYKLFPYPLDSSDISFNGTINQVTLYAPNILYVNKYYTIVFTNGNSFKLNQIGNKILIYGNSSNYVEIRFLKGCIANLSYVNATLTRSSWSWEKLNGLSYRFVPLENENALITFQLNLCKSENLSAKYDDYAMNYLSLNNLLSPSLIENIILYYLTVPLIYFSLLVSITYGLSRLLGGRRGIIPRVI